MPQPHQFALKVQKKYSKGWRKEAKHLGQLWDIVRNYTTIATDAFYYITRYNKLAEVEMDPISYIYKIRGDRAPLKIGDQLVGKDPASVYEGSALLERYTIVSMRLLKNNIGIRTDDLIAIYRPNQPVDSYSIE